MKTRIVDGGEFTNQNPPMMPAAPKIFSGSFAVAVWFLTVAVSVPPAKAAPVQLLSARNPSVPLLVGGDDNSIAPTLSPDGRFVVFISAANDLVPGGNSFFCLNVFLHDCASNTTVLVSGNLSGTGGGNGSSMLGQVSTNGQFIVFQSDASNLVPNDTNGVTDIFVRDLVAGTTTLVSVSTNGGPANGASTDPVMTPDGRYVAFISRASNLVPGDNNGIPDIFIRDLVAGTNQLVSVGALCSTLVSPGTIMATPVMTPDGRYVAFFSLATNLVSAVPGTTTGEVYVFDRLAGTMTWASTNAAAMVSAMVQQTNATSYHPRLSDDGQYVAFKTGATASTGVAVILQYDLTTGATTVINTNGIGGDVGVDETYGPEMTPDGRYIAFARQEGSTNSGYASVHVWDTQLASDTLVSDDGSGVPTNTTSHTPNISPDGRFVAFLSNATNLVGNAVTNGFHIYLRDLQFNTTQLVDMDTNGVGSTDDTLTTLSLSADGQYVAFGSPDGSLVSSDNNNAEDVFVRDLVAGTTEMISQRDVTVIPQAADGFTMMSPSSVSLDGRWMAFTSRADDLVLNDTNQALNVFVRDLVNGTNFLASVGADGGPALGGNSENALISADGRYVVFISAATNLVTGPVNTNANVFRRDLQTGTTVLVSVETDGVSPGNSDASGLVISPDGRYVVFQSRAINLVAGMPSGLNTYWRDMNLGQTVGLPGPYGYVFGPSLSSDGRYVAYAYSVMASSPTLHIWDTRISMEDIYTNANAGTVTSAAIDPTGTKILYRIANTLYVDNIATRSNLFSIQSTASIRNAACWTDDGTCLVFLSNTNLGSGSDGTNRVYLRDFQAGTLSLIGVAGPSAGAWVAVSDAPVISGDGRFVAYRSVATNATEFTALANVCLFDRLTGSNTVLATEQAGSGPIVWVSRPVISDDGATIAFLDACADLVNGDLNRVPDALGTFLDAALIDSDGDGIPDWWMMKYFGHPTGQAYDNSLASDDADGSGESNLQDYLAGTDPTDPNSVFRILTSVPASNSMTLTWFAVPGRTYQVLYTTNLDDPMWLTVTGNVWVTGSQGYYLAPVAQPQSFFRVFKSD
jgi:Tol biopolymer transport system component